MGEKAGIAYAVPGCVSFIKIAIRRRNYKENVGAHSWSAAGSPIRSGMRLAGGVHASARALRQIGLLFSG